jgi:hypothetical protein
MTLPLPQTSLSGGNWLVWDRLGAPEVRFQKWVSDSFEGFVDIIKCFPVKWDKQVATE